MNRIIPIILLIFIGFLMITNLFYSGAIIKYGHPNPRVSQVHMEAGVEQTGALNLVTAIYLNYRVYDTLGEAAVFFAAALGVFMLLKSDRSQIE